MRGLFRGILLFVLATAFTITAAMAWLIYSDNGLAWLTARVGEWVPGELKVVSVAGRLDRQIEISGLHYRDHDRDIKIRYLNLAWDPIYLLDGRFHINSLLIEGSSLALLTAETKKSSGLPSLESPLGIDVSVFTLNEATITGPAPASPVQINHITAEFFLDKKGLQIPRFELQMPDVNANIQGQVQSAVNLPVSFELGWEVKRPDLPAVSGHGTIKGNAKKLVIQQQVTGPVDVNITLTLNDMLIDPDWEINTELTNLDPAIFRPGLPSVQAMISLQGRGNLNTAHAGGHYDLRSEQFPSFNGSFELEMRDWTTWDVQLNGPGQSHLEFTVADMDGDLRWEASADLPSLDPSVLGFGLPSLQSVHSLRATGGRNHVSASGNSSVVSGQFGTFDGVYELEGQDWTRWQIRKLQLHRAGTETLATISGTADYENSNLELDLDGEWENLVWPLDGAGEFTSPGGRLSLQGNPDEYVLSSSLRIQIPGFPELPLDFSGQGNTTGMRIGQLSSDSSIGHLQLEGSVAWQDRATWELSITGNDLNPEQLYPGWPGNISLHGRVSGQKAETLTLQITDARCQGQLRGYPLELRGSMDVNDQKFVLDEVSLQSGSSRLALHGSIEESYDLTWRIDSPELMELHPLAHGHLNAHGSVTGSRIHPRIKGELTGEKLSFEDLGIGSLSATADIDTRENTNLSLNLTAGQVLIANRFLDEVTITGQGKSGQHRLQGTLGTGEQSLVFVAEGGILEQQWKGRLERLTVSDPVIGNWSSESGTMIEVGREFVSSSPLCMSRDQATRFCLEGEWSGSGGWQVKTLARSLPIAMLARGLPEDVETEGMIGWELQATGIQSRPVTANGKVTLTPGKFSAEMDSETTAVVPFTSGEANIILDETGYHTAWKLVLDLPGSTPITGDVHLQPFDPARDDLYALPLQGTVSVMLQDISPFMVFFPGLETLEGSLDVGLRLGGTTGEPRIDGRVALDGSSLVLPGLGVEFREIELAVQGKDTDALQITGHARSGQGQVQITGMASLARSTEWPVEIQVQGEKLEIINLPEAWVLVSPNLKTRIKPGQIDLEGEVSIPEAQLEPGRIEMAIPVSSDVIVLGKEEQISKEDAIRLTGQVRVTLGNKVSVEGFGFTGRVEGAILTMLRGNDPPAGTGELVVKDGKYSAYGQKLSIDNGRLIFAGGSLEDPGLDMRAVRKVGDVVAGVHITGNAGAPTLTLFSNPSMSHDKVLSYLLLGRPLDNVSASEGDMLMQAATTLGLQGGGMLTKQLAQSLGLDVLSLDANGNAESASLMIGKYLSPKLYLGYGVGLFQPVGRLLLRYDISRRFLLKAESGAETGVDVLYKIEH